METRLPNIIKTTNVTNLTKEALIEFYKLHPNKKKIKQPVYFLKAVEFCSTFDIQIDITLAIFQEKLQNHTF